MSSKRLRDEDIESFLAIPSGSEDGEDFSEAGSDEDMEKIRSAVSFFSESLSDVEPLLSPQRHHSLSPANVPLASEQQSSNPQPSTSGETSPKCSGAKRQIRITRRSSTSVNTAFANKTKNSAHVIKRKKRKFIWKKKLFNQQILSLLEIQTYSRRLQNLKLRYNIFHGFLMTNYWGILWKKCKNLVFKKILQSHSKLQLLN